MVKNTSTKIKDKKDSTATLEAAPLTMNMSSEENIQSLVHDGPEKEV
jgi:hypothetical protein